MTLLEKQKQHFADLGNGEDDPLPVPIVNANVPIVRPGTAQKNVPPPPNLMTTNSNLIPKPTEAPAFPMSNIFSANNQLGSNPIVFRKNDTSALAGPLIVKPSSEQPPQGLPPVPTPPKEAEREETKELPTNDPTKPTAGAPAPEDFPVFPSDSTIPDMKAFVTRPVPKNVVVQCTIQRDKSGMARFFPKYYLYFSEGLRFIMTGKKRANNKTSNYLMCVSKTELEKDSPFFVGKLR
jgi:hypothetical protein